jgi:2-oxoglutarate dehydrogenase E2 component (dihydrolipoamide succinyltransferase)
MTMTQIFEITMPKLGETVTEGTVAEWLKSVGDAVAFDDPLILVSTDKVDSEIPSPYDGVLLEITVPDGGTVPVGTVLARIGPAGSLPAASADSAAAPPVPRPGPAAAPAAPNGAAPAVPRAHGNGRALSPVVRRLAAEHGIDLGTINGSGSQGRIMREDVLAAVLAKPQAPLTPTTAAGPVSAGPTAAARPASGQERADDVRSLSRIRLVTAERMVESKRISPHVWTSVEVDLEAIEQLRVRHRERFRVENGCSLTYLAFIGRAVCDALRAFPTVNASVDMEQRTLILHRRVDLAIAVDLDEQGLMAPVIRDADLLNLRGMARAIKAVGDGAKNRTLGSDDLSGSTFTLTNPGPLGSFASAPIINQPNVAIMSTEGVTRRPTVVGDAIAIHHMCVLGFSYDHRAFDGVTAARFLLHVRDALQNRDWAAELG